MDTKLKADIAESAVITELLKRGFRVLKPVGDRLPYDLALDLNSKLLRIQVKCAWYNKRAKSYFVDARRTKTNRRRMVRERYDKEDFDFAILYIHDNHTFYVMPIDVFSGYGSTICLIETDKRQRKPKSADYRECWNLLFEWALHPVTGEGNLSNSVEPLELFKGNTAPSFDTMLEKA